MSKQKKYQPWNSKHSPWEKIEREYLDYWNGQHKQLLKLVQEILKSDLKERLFGSTSMDKLVISIYEIIDFKNEALHISFDLSEHKWIFEYYSLSSVKTNIVKEYGENEGIKMFYNFVHYLRW